MVEVKNKERQVKMAGGENVFIEWIDKNIEKGKTVLELGSGHISTQQLSKMGYKMISIEHNANYLNYYESKYIHAPMKNGWYDVDVLQQELKGLKYDVILIDGPVGVGNKSRLGFYDNMELFDTSVPILIHDCERFGERELKEKLSTKLNRHWFILDDSVTVGKSALV